jgi:hypothetical protein
MKDMKTIFNTLFIALVLVCSTLMSCKDEMEYNNSGVSAAIPVWPEEGTSVELFNSDAATLDFQWEAANAAGAPYYQIVFYAADCTTELHRVAPTDRQLLVSVTHRTLNAVAAIAGIAPNASGDIYWAVATVKGTIEDISAKRKLTLQSYQAFDDLPVSLYVVGAATEGGADVTAAPKFKETGKGAYEIYTYLQAGEGYYFTNRNTPGGGRNFTVADDFLVETDGVPATPPTVLVDGVYRVTISFITAKVTVTAITDVRYFVPNTNTYTPMTYDGYGKWSLQLTLPAFTGSSATRQYKFVATVGSTTYSWGCNTQAGQANPPIILDGDYFYVYQNAHSTSSNNRARYSYQYMAELSGQEVDLLLDMSSDNDHYTHVVDAGDLTVYPVEQFIAPAEDASVVLSKVAGSSQSFSWQPSSGTGPTPKYDVVFYSDAEGTNEIGTAPAGNNQYASTATVLHSVIETMAAAANIPAEGTGDIWWSVRTTVLTQSGIAAIPPRKLTVTRLPGIPATVYITGAASEAGTTLANAIVMKKTADGIFEIYTRLTAGSTYCFVDRTSGTPRQFSVSGTAINEGGTTSASAGVYKIVLNFNTDVADYSEVTKVEFFHPWGGNRVELTYTSNGVWTGSVTPSDWATDDRYKFKLTRNPGGTKDWIGEGRRDSQPTGNADFYYMKEGIYDGEWTGEDSNMWKIPSSFGGWNGNTFDITFSVRADAPYTHMITKN